MITLCISKIKDIFHPLNPLGKDRKTLAYDLYDVLPINNKRTLNIVWTGETLTAAYTDVFSPGYGYDTVVTPYKMTYRNGNSSAETIEVLAANHHRNPDHSIYFDCINVTYLEVNGDILING